MASQLFRLWIALNLATLVSCAADSEPEGGCRVMGDCPDGQECRDGVCAEPTPVSEGGLVDADLGPCAPGVDLDGDGVDGETECARGTDPENSDTDGDGVPDGIEIQYPMICVADDPADQRRDPLPMCLSDADCREGERCRGLDPTMADTDGDGVPDRNEDTDLDGEIEGERGESDPRLADTDGDGTTDDDEGLFICRPDGLAMPTLYIVPDGTVQLALSETWSAQRSSSSGGTAGAVFEDEAAEVAGFVIDRPAVATSVAEVEASVLAALPGAAGILVGRGFTTHDGRSASTSFYRISEGALSAASARDGLFTELGLAPAGAAAGEWRSGVPLYLEITTAVTLDGPSPRAVVVGAFMPTEAFDDNSTLTAIRARDLTNVTGVAANARVLGFACQSFISDRAARADFLWLVDTSGSMNGDQERLGNVAGRFFTTLSEAGVDFRVGVFEAATTDVDLGRAPGFAFIDGTDPMGVTQLQYQVTRAAYMGMGADTLRPFDLGRSGEEPVAAGVRVIEEFERYASEMSMDPNRTLREDTQVVAFFVTDEPGTNDDSRFFAQDTARWGDTPEARIMGALDFYNTRDVLTFGLVRDYGDMCPAQRDFPKCAVLGTGGAFIPITTATDEEVGPAMDRIVEAVAGAASIYILESQPISSTLKVALDGVEVPRSRADGFDYDGASNSIVFRGRMYRPEIGSEVVVSYRRWGGDVE